MVWFNLHFFEPGLAGLRKHDPHYGFDAVTYAFLFGILSGTSLPLGAYLGIRWSPVSDAHTAMMMAFGAGALLFAVTVELYGHALHEVSKGRLTLMEMFTTISGALAGAAFYLFINRWLEQTFGVAESSSTTPRTSSSPRKKASTQPDGEESPLAFTGWFRSTSDPESAPLMSQSRSFPSSPASTFMRKFELSRRRPRDKVIRAALDDDEVRRAKSTALALFIGLVVDGVPEGILMGFLSAEGHLTPVLLVSLWIANLPEACASASLLTQAHTSKVTVIVMWTALCILVGVLCGLACFSVLYFFPAFGQPEHGHGGQLPMSVLLGIALIEGITGGSMLACISSVMLPEALTLNKHGRVLSQSGFLCTAGFLMSVALKAVFG
eukprot:TRINITY_DN73277_c0_g1_i1.p1 TRINITY_DN73277_c0_g1~~TRINITY_DN73277_c0_g1_i1.p1  ORF type:complete len:381 (-),score=16.15 TRINITY_DN73277_c0_g1_i1:282-1424(-)